MKVECGLKVGWFRLIWFDAVVRECGIRSVIYFCFLFFFLEKSFSERFLFDLVRY